MTESTVEDYVQEHHTPKYYNALPWVYLPQLHCCYAIVSSSYLSMSPHVSVPNYMVVKNWPLNAILYYTLILLFT
jgi:hypothetical protein